MSVVDLEDSDSSDDIFVVKQIKPVNKLNLQQALIIKYGVLSSLSSRKIKNKKRKKGDRSPYSSAEKRKIEQVVENETSAKKSLKVDRDIKSQSSQRGEEISQEARKSSSGSVQAKKQNTQEREKRCPLETETGEKYQSIVSLSHTSNKSANCIDLKAENHYRKSRISGKRIKLNIKEEKVKENEERLPQKKPCVSDETKMPELKESSQEISSKNKEALKTEVKLEESLTIEENDFLETELKAEEFTDGFQSNLLNAVNAFQELEEERFGNNNKLLSYLLKKIICNETRKQVYLEQLGKNAGKSVEKLLSETDYHILERFFYLNENAAQVFVRMLGRKICWRRVSSINYDDISNNLETEFEILHKENFVDVNIEDEDLKTQLNLLSKPEVMQLCRAFNVSFKSRNLCKKEALIDSLIEDSKKQRSVSDMFKRKTSQSDRNDLLKLKIKEYLKMCIKISDIAFEAFYKIILLHSFPYYMDEEDKRLSSALHLSLQIHKNFIKFPEYKLSPTVVFETQGDFDEYRKALLLYESFETAINDKNHNEFLSVFNKAKEQFKRLLENNEYLRRFLNLESFLKKFSAGTVYARILSKFCTTFKKQSDNLEKILTAQLLLDQNLFLTRKKGEWYDILSKALESEKNYQSAAEVVIKSLEDPLVSEVQKLTLQMRGQLILKKKNSGITDVKLREVLNDLCTLSVQEPHSIEIKGKALSMDKSLSTKCVYIQDSEEGKLYTSVEERAISYYKSNGFTKGYHAEGLIVQSMYFLLFYDIIYGSSVQGVFQSPYQEAPLDFYSASFYDSRKEEIDVLLSDMLSWSEGEIERKIKDMFNKNYMTTCIIKWDNEFTPDLYFEIIKCITMPILVLIFQRFLKNFRVYRSGFPDLTLWNPETKKCKFVEVKSPNDRLSPGQRVWLDYLRSIGLDCEVCNVKNFSGKSFV